MIFFDCLKISEIRFFIKQVVELRGVSDFKFHQPALLFSVDRNILGRFFQNFINFGDAAVAGHVNICSCLNTLDGALRTKNESFHENITSNTVYATYNGFTLSEGITFLRQVNMHDVS